MKHLLGLAALSLLANLALATAPSEDSRQALEAADPDDYADDICWVAPEWREDS
jgi:hypothetical protein